MGKNLWEGGGRPGSGSLVGLRSLWPIHLGARHPPAIWDEGLASPPTLPPAQQDPRTPPPTPLSETPRPRPSSPKPGPGLSGLGVVPSHGDAPLPGDEPFPSWAGTQSSKLTCIKPDYVAVDQPDGVEEAWLPRGAAALWAVICCQHLPLPSAIKR